MDIRRKNRNLPTLRKVSIHVSVWLLLFFLNYLIVRDYSVTFQTWFEIKIKIWLIYIALFYINFLFLMPYFLFRKKILIYVMLTLITLFTANIFRTESELRYFRKNFNPDQDFIFHPPPDEFKPKRTGPLPRHEKPPRAIFFPFLGREMFSFYGILMVYAASTTIGLIIKWQDSEKLRAETEKEKLYAELSYLKQQVNPHFLFNALNNIYSLSLSKSDMTTNAILKLSSILRYMLYETNKKQVSLKDEVEIIMNYIDLQKLRLTEKVKTDFKVTGNAGNYLIEPLLLLPFIENAFKYGADNMHASFIKINIDIADDLLILKVENKIVLNPAKNNNDYGIGLKNIQRRLELLYPNNHTLTINENDKIFIVYLSIKLKK